MGDKTGIEWTDATWNPVTGCSKVSEGCRNCYAERVFPRAYGTERKFSDVRCHEDRLDKPLRWKKLRRIFVNSMSDLFHEDVPALFIRSVFTTMAIAKQHTFQVLTKRPQRMMKVLSDWEREGVTLREGCGVQLPNVLIGVSVEDQRTADERIPLLLQTPAAVRWISAEPLLGPINLSHITEPTCFYFNALSKKEGIAFRATGLDWVVCGGESGPGARPCHPQWVRSLRDQCQGAGVPFFFKQWGNWVPDWGGDHLLYADGKLIKGTHDHPDAWDKKICEPVMRVKKRTAGRLLDGLEWSEFPEGVKR